MTNERPKNVMRIHIFTDGFGWSEDREADYAELTVVYNAEDLPILSDDWKLTTFVCNSIDDIEELRELLAQLSMELSNRVVRTINRKVKGEDDATDNISRYQTGSTLSTRSRSSRADART